MTINNETLGQSAEKVICDLSELDSSHLNERSDETYEEILTPLITKALNELPSVIRHTGLEEGKRGGHSKSAIDFYLNDEQTLSVKTNKNKAPRQDRILNMLLVRYGIKEGLYSGNIQNMQDSLFKTINYHKTRNKNK